MAKAWAVETVTKESGAEYAAYHDRRGGDESTAVKWWRRWCAACGCAPVMRATPLQGLKAQREVESWH